LTGGVHKSEKEGENPFGFKATAVKIGDDARVPKKGGWGTKKGVIAKEGPLENLTELKQPFNGRACRIGTTSKEGLKRMFVRKRGTS